MKINRTGIVLLLVSGVVSVVALELSLRIAGYLRQNSRVSVFTSSVPLNVSEGERAYDAERDYELFQQPSQQEDGSLWAIGDSYTNAGNVNSNESYPAYLFRLLRNEGYHYSVINLGQCEDPTWGVYERLRNILENKQFGKILPSVVIILAGSSDSFYYLFSGGDPLARAEQKLVEFSPEQIPWYHTLKIFKVFRFLKLAIVNGQLSSGGGSITSGEMRSLQMLYREIRTKHQRNQLYASDWARYEPRVELLLDRHREFVDGSLNEFRLDDKPRFVFNTLVVPMMRYYSGRLDYENALTTLMAFARDYPEFFWNDKRSHPVALHIMSQTFRFQSRYTASEMNAFLRESSESVPNLRTGRLYKLASKLFQAQQNNEEQVRSIRLATWKKLVELSNKYKFKILLQNYAPNFTAVNNSIQFVSDRYNLPLVNNHDVFKSQLKTYDRSVLFADDNHFMPKGYELMAENVLSILKQKHLIRK